MFISCLRSTNAESQERLFRQTKHIGLALKATNHNEEKCLTGYSTVYTDRVNISDSLRSISNQNSMVSIAASQVDRFNGTYKVTHFSLVDCPVGKPTSCALAAS